MTDAILIVGGGVAGLTAAIDCSRAGARAIVVELRAIAGGRLAAAMTDEASVGAEIDGVPIPKLAALAQAQDIELMTLTDVEELRGRPGNFSVSLRERARFVTDACTRCNRCRPVCPVIRPNEYDAGLTYRKAIFTPLPQTLPAPFVIDIDSCLNTPPNYLPCNRCTEVCDDDAIHFNLPRDRLHQRQVGAVILAVGSEVADGRDLVQYGYGAHPDIVTTAELDRLLMAPGPTGGFVAKPSNEEYPDSILMILDELTPFSASTAARQIHRLAAQDIAEIALLVTAQPATSDEKDLVSSLPGGVTVLWGLLQGVEGRADNRIDVSYAAFAGNRVPENQYDMVVLGFGVRPAQGLEILARVFGCDLTGGGFIARPASGAPSATSCPGIYVAGAAGGPSTLRESVDGARAAAAAALSHLDPRLLRQERAPAATKNDRPKKTKADEDAMRAGIESALFALLKRDE